MRASPRGAAVVIAALVWGTAALAGCGGGTGREARGGLSGAVRTPPLQVGSVILPDESPGAGGAPFEMRAEPGGLLLVYFGFTSCPDICPTTLSDVGRALQKLGSERRRVEVAMVTVDPERDTGEVISSYLDHFVDGGHALRTTDPARQQAAQDAFRVVARRVPDGATYTYEHTAVTYVVDERGEVVVEWPFGTAPDAMRRDLQVLLRRRR